MPTIVSTSADLAVISLLDPIPCARSTSLNCAPIDFTGLSAFIALCMTTDMFFQRTAESCLSVRPTRLRPRNVTLPPLTLAGGTSSWDIANSSVDLPQPDSPTIPMNSPGLMSKLTSSTARTSPRSVAYSTDRLRTCKIGPVYARRWTEAGLSSVRTLHPPSAHRPQGRIADLVEGVVEQREGGAEQGDARPGDHRPQVLSGLQGLVVLRPVEHRAPAHRVGIAEPDELQAGGEQDRVERVGEEA